MVHKRIRFLIQHRETKLYLTSRTGLNDKLETTNDAWKAWGVETAASALYNLETNRYMPEDKDNYRIVKTEDTRTEVEEDERHFKPLSEDS